MGDVDALRFVPFGKLVLLQVWMAFKLVSCGNHTCLLDQSFHLSFAEVRDSDRSGLARLVNLLHSLVSLDEITVASLDLSVRVLGKERRTTGKCRRPMHQPEIDIIGSEILERCIEGGLNIFGSMIVVPDLGDQEDFRSRDTGLLDSRADSRLGTVNSCGIDVAYTSL